MKLEVPDKLYEYLQAARDVLGEEDEAEVIRKALEYYLTYTGGRGV